MKRLLLIALLALAGCKDEAVQDVSPMALTADSTGYFCQMNVLEHPGPKAQAHLQGFPRMPVFFSQVRDGFAFARMDEQMAPILQIWVNDMGAPEATWEDPGAANWIRAEDAFYVMGSDRTGGMGLSDLVPFADPSAAAAFASRWGGRVVRMDEVPDDAVLAPQAGTAPDGGAGEDAEFKARLRALSDDRTGG